MVSFGVVGVVLFILFGDVTCCRTVLTCLGVGHCLEVGGGVALLHLLSHLMRFHSVRVPSGTAIPLGYKKVTEGISRNWPPYTSSHERAMSSQRGTALAAEASRLTHETKGGTRGLTDS